jgi:dTDP-4-dehydrorhamnose 3,5-epimerase
MSVGFEGSGPLGLAAAAIADEPRDQGPDQAMAARIAGVRIERIPGSHDHRGSLLPFLNPAQPFWSEPIVWGYLLTVRPGRIKGWNMHQRQADRYVVLSGNLRVALHDDREGSPDRGHTCEFHFTPGSAGLLLIPPGVWHATQNWGRSLGRVANFPTRPYDPQDPDKFRLEPSTAKIPFDWRLRDG